MFEHRLGLALHKTIGEVRAIPYAEFKSWQFFSMIEPFGFHDDEYRTAAILAMLYNINKGKGRAKDVSDFMRDLKKAVLNELKEKPSIDDMSRDEIVNLIKKDFGIR